MSTTVALPAVNSTIVRSNNAVHASNGRLGLARLASLALSLAPGLAVRAAARRLTTPRRFPTPAREDGWLEGARRDAIVVDGCRLALTSWGDGPTVLLVHGWEGRGSQWGALAHRLAANGFRALALDAPAHGRSDGRSTNLREIAAAIGAVLDRVGPVAGVVAHSAGSVGTALALADREVPRLALFAPALDVAGHLRWGAALSGLPIALVERAWDRVGAQVGLRREDLTPESLGAYLPHELLVVHDADDAEAPLRDAHRVVDAVPGATLVVTHGLGHRRLLREPAALGPVVAFLRRGVATEAPKPNDRLVQLT